MEDVAREAGVARVTVSRALSDPDKVSPATRNAVRQAIERLGYVPNLTAGSLASRRSRIVGAIVPTLSNSWFADAMDGLAETLGAAGYQLMLGQSRYHAQAEAGLVDTFMGRQVDALVLTGVVHEEAVRRQLRRMQLPTVEIWDMTDDPIDRLVGFSNVAVGEAVAHHFFQRGRRTLAYMGATEGRSIKRLNGLQAGCAAAGLEPPIFEMVNPTSTMQDGARCIAALLERQPRIDGVFCSNDTMAIGVLSECRRLGIDVPGRVAVVGFSDLSIASACVPTLTSVRVQTRELGSCAGRVLLDRLKGDPHAASLPRIIDTGFEIVQRESG